MSADFAARFNFTAERYRPMKQRVETCDAHTARGWFDVFEES